MLVLAIGAALPVANPSTVAALLSALLFGGSTKIGTMPRPPAPATAAASSGVPTPPMAASWIGRVQPTRSVKGVRINES